MSALLTWKEIRGSEESKLMSCFLIVSNVMFLHPFYEIDTLQTEVMISRAGRYDGIGIIVIPRYVNSPILIPKVFVLYDFIVIDITGDIANRSRNESENHASDDSLMEDDSDEVNNIQGNEK